MKTRNAEITFFDPRKIRMVTAASIVGFLALANGAHAQVRPIDTAMREAIELALKNQNSKAEEKLKTIVSSSKDNDRTDALMALARVQFQSNKLDESLKTLEMVPKGSDQWFEALEEKAWVALRQQNPDKALSHLETNLKELFLPLVGPESYFLAAYSHLRTCNYEAALKITSLFKDRFRNRISSLQEISRSTAPTPVMSSTLEKVMNKGWSSQTLGRDAHLLPRSVIQDAQLRHIYATLRANSTVERKAAFYDRIRQMAKVDLDEMSRIINQFRVLDVEITQRVYSRQPVKAALAGNDQAPKMDSPTRIRFPHDGEVWLDEVDKYHVRVKGCVPQGRGAKGQVL
jgi:tetratricopeptide (TPR) repeat protein